MYCPNVIFVALCRAAVITRYSEDIFEATNKLFKCGYDHKCSLSSGKRDSNSHVNICD